MPFEFLRSFKITLEDGSEHSGKTEKDLQKIFLTMSDGTDNLYQQFTISFIPNYLKIKKEVQKCIEPLLNILKDID